MLSCARRSYYVGQATSLDGMRREFDRTPRQAHKNCVIMSLPPKRPELAGNEAAAWEADTSPR